MCASGQYNYITRKHIYSLEFGTFRFWYKLRFAVILYLINIYQLFTYLQNYKVDEQIEKHLDVPPSWVVPLSISHEGYYLIIDCSRLSIYLIAFIKWLVII